MRKAASHYIWCNGQKYRLHYLEWDEKHQFTGIYPLTEEIAGVAFFNGTMVVTPKNVILPAEAPEEEWQRFSAEVKPGIPINTYLVSDELHRLHKLILT